MFVQSLSSPEVLFEYVNLAAIPFWVILALLGWTCAGKWMVKSYVLLTAALYTYLLWFEKEVFIADPQTAFTYTNITQAFMNPNIIVLGWVHYLSFDLLTGLLIVNEAKSRGIWHILTIPFLAVTLLAGPSGYFLWYVFKIVTFPVRALFGSSSKEINKEKYD